MKSLKHSGLNIASDDFSCFTNKLKLKIMVMRVMRFGKEQGPNEYA